MTLACYSWLYNKETAPTALALCLQMPYLNIISIVGRLCPVYLCEKCCWQFSCCSGGKSLRLLRRQSWWLDAATPGPASVARRMGSNNRQLSESHILEFVEAFNKFDETQSGLVSTKQLGNLLRHLGINPTKEELQVKGGIKIKTVKFLLFCTVLTDSI